MNDKTDERSQMMYSIFIIEILIDALTRTHTIRRKKEEWGEEFGESMPHPETECMHSYVKTCCIKKHLKKALQVPSWLGISLSETPPFLGEKGPFSLPKSANCMHGPFKKKNAQVK